VSVLLLLAGALTALVQYLMPASLPAPRSPVQASGSNPVPGPPPVRKIAPATAPTPTGTDPPPPAPAPPTVAAKSEPAVPVAPASPPVVRTETPTPLVLPTDGPAVPTPPPAAAEAGRSEVAEAETTEGPPALALVDLNTATVADLNRLRGGGAIGRAIAAKRPYTQVSDLLTKRVLSRAVYDRIKEQVTVR
jgi:DNA uptake protein ComE-like DNA-binding protein